MLSRETWRSSFGVVGDRVLLGVGHATALHSGRPRDILCGRSLPPERETFGALRCGGGLRPKFLLVEGIWQASSCGIPTAIRKRPQRSAHGQRQQVGHPEHQLACYPSRPCSVPGLLESARHAVPGGDGSIARAACTQRSRRSSVGPDGCSKERRPPRVLSPSPRPSSSPFFTQTPHQTNNSPLTCLT